MCFDQKKRKVFVESFKCFPAFFYIFANLARKFLNRLIMCIMWNSRTSEETIKTPTASAPAMAKVWIPVSINWEVCPETQYSIV